MHKTSCGLLKVLKQFSTSHANDRVHDAVTGTGASVHLAGPLVRMMVAPESHIHTVILHKTRG